MYSCIGSRRLSERLRTGASALSGATSASSSSSPASPTSATDGELPSVADVGDAGDDDEDALVAPDKALAPVRSRSLSRRDPMQLYIDEIRRYPLLSREEEHELAVEYTK